MGSADILRRGSGFAVQRDVVGAQLMEIAEALAKYRFRFSCERELQEGIHRALVIANIEVEKEYVLDGQSRPDFLTKSGIAVEIKTKGSLTQLLRQIARYALHPDVKAVLVVGSPYWIASIPVRLEQKPVMGVRLMGSLF